MPPLGMAASLGLGTPRAATSSGSAPAPAATGFNIDTQDTEANILARTGDEAGLIAFATDTFNYLVTDGKNNWAITPNGEF
jgi:hypothetical protein